MTLKLYRPDPDGGLEPAPVTTEDYRAPAAVPSLEGGASCSNPEVEQTDPRIAVAVRRAPGVTHLRGHGRGVRHRLLGIGQDRARQPIVCPASG